MLRPRRTYLFVRSSFWEGFGRCLDLFGTLEYKRTRKPEQADYLALRSDWEAVGRDMWYALGEFEKQHPELVAAREKARSA